MNFQVLKEVHAKYPDYIIHDNLKVVESAKETLRKSEESVLGVIHDIHLLSCTNFVVCTHSSNVSHTDSFS